MVRNVTLCNKSWIIKNIIEFYTFWNDFDATTKKERMWEILWSRFFSLNTDHKVFNCLWFKVSVESKVEAHTCLEKVVVDFPLIKWKHNEQWRSIKAVFFFERENEYRLFWMISSILNEKRSLSLCNSKNFSHIQIWIIFILMYVGIEFILCTHCFILFSVKNCIDQIRTSKLTFWNMNSSVYIWSKIYN